MLHLDDQTMPVYQQKIANEYRSLEFRLQALRTEIRDPGARAGKARPEDLEQLDSHLRAIQKKIDQIGKVPQEMRDRLREEIDSSLEELRLSLDKCQPDEDADK